MEFFRLKKYFIARLLLTETFNRFSKLIGFDKFLWESDSSDLSAIFIFIYLLFFFFKTLPYEIRAKREKFLHF